MKFNLCQLYGLVLSFFSIMSVSKELIQQKNSEHFVHLYNTLQYADKWALQCSGLCLWVLYGSRNFRNLMLWDPTIILLKRRGLYLSCVFVHAYSVTSDSETMDYNPPGSSVCGIFQARIVEWVAIAFSRVSSQLRDHILVLTKVSLLQTHHSLIWLKSYT